MKYLFMFTAIALFSITANAKFKGEAEAGAVIVSGNSESESYSLKTQNTYTLEQDSYTISGRYLQTTANGVESARNWDAGVRYDRQFNETMSGFLGQKAEADPFAGFIQRDSSDVGGKYSVYNDESYKWFFEVGYRYTKTLFIGKPNTADNFGRIYSEFQKIMSKDLTFKYWLEYLPNFTNSEVYLANT